MQISLSQKAVRPEKTACGVRVFTFAFLFPNMKQSHVRRPVTNLLHDFKPSACRLTHLQESKGPHVGKQGVGCCGEMCFLVSLADFSDTKPNV